jgi:hypothetical protein
MAKRFKAAQTIRFTYNHPPAKSVSDYSDLGAAFTTGEYSDRQKEVFVLHPLWHSRVHALDLKRMTEAERETLRAIFDPETKKKGPHKFPLVNDILRRMNPLEEVKNPQTFYHKFVKVFIRNKDVYRQYDPSRMVNATVVRPSRVKGNVENPKPLFHKVETKPQPPKTMHGQVRKLSPDELKALAAKMGVGVSKKK